MGRIQRKEILESILVEVRSFGEISKPSSFDNPKSKIQNPK
jgi:hypothetical protein